MKSEVTDMPYASDSMKLEVYQAAKLILESPEKNFSHTVDGVSPSFVHRLLLPELSSSSVSTAMKILCEEGYLRETGNSSQRKRLYRLTPQILGDAKTISVQEVKDEPAKRDQSIPVMEKIIGIESKINSLCEALPTINKISGLYTRLAEVNTNLDNITWRTGLKNREQLIELKKSQLQVAEVMLDFCESMSEHVTKLAKVVAAMHEEVTK
jgi:hypothetical protein